MGRVGLHGLVQAFSRYADAVPTLDLLFNRLENALNGQLDSTNLATGAVIAANLGAGSVTAAALGVGSVTSAAVDSTVAKITTAQFTGDGTSSREINIGYRARFVFLVRHDTSSFFIAWGSTSSALAAVQQDSAGNITTGGSDFSGSTANGFTLGSAAGGGASNANTKTFSYIALG